MIDWNTITTDALLQLIPETEDDRWEHKGADLFQPSKKGDLKAELAKQVSAFANSGGGYLVLGLSKTRQWEPCPEFLDRTSMKDVLAQLVTQAVEYPLQSFKVHPVKFTGDPSQMVYVIEVLDSVAAPHQAKDDRRTYYWRIDGHSKPAPHFHLELLRNRFTKAVLKIEEVNHQIVSASTARQQLTIRFEVTIKNVSMQLASHWAIHVKHMLEHFNWETKTDPSENLANGICVRSPGAKPELMPGEKGSIKFMVIGDAGGTGYSKPMVHLWERMALSIIPVSQNAMGEEVVFGNWGKDWLYLRPQFERYLDEMTNR